MSTIGDGPTFNGNAVEVWADPHGNTVIADRGVDVPNAMDAWLDGGFEADDQSRAVMATMSRWVRSNQPEQRAGGLLDRDRYIPPESPIGKMQTARLALADDVVGTAADVTESLALPNVSISVKQGTGDLEALRDEQWAWNEWFGEFDGDTLARSMWRTLITDSQLVLAWMPRRTSYTVPGKTAGGAPKRKKFVDLWVPGEWTLLPHDRVVPVGSQLMGRGQLAYQADPLEAAYIDIALAERATLAKAQFPDHPQADWWFQNNDDGLFIHDGDDIVKRIIVGKYDPTPLEHNRLLSYGITDTSHLYLLNPRWVHRHTLTRSAGQAFADIRMERVLELLDLKRQLRQRDRATLLAGTHFIIVIKIGTEGEEAKPKELAHARANAKTIGQQPLIVGDHRLSVEIVQVNDEQTLSQEKHDTIDTRLGAAVWGTFVPTGKDASDPTKLARVIAAGLHGRRKMLRRFIEAAVFDTMRRANPQLTGKAKLIFHPKKIALNFDQAEMQALIELREKRVISRDTLLGALELDQDEEARQLELEAVAYDDTFNEFVPHGHNPGDDPGDDGSGLSPRTQTRRGGRRDGGSNNGGGAAPGSGQGEEGRTFKSRSDVAATSRDDLIVVARDLGVPYARKRKPDLVTDIADELGLPHDDEGDPDDLDD